MKAILSSNKHCCRPLIQLPQLNVILCNDETQNACLCETETDFTIACGTTSCPCAQSISYLVDSYPIPAACVMGDNIQSIYVLLCQIQKHAYRFRTIRLNVYLAVLHHLENILAACIRIILDMKLTGALTPFADRARTRYKTYWGQKWICYNALRAVCATLITRHSTLPRFQTVRNFLDVCWDDYKIQRFLKDEHTNRNKISKYVLYFVFGLRTKITYVGMTTTGFKNRSFQHLANLMGHADPWKANAQTPWYRCGVHADQYIFVPIWSGSRCDPSKLRLLEFKVLRWFQPCGNTPWVHQRLRSKDVAMGKSAIFPICINKPPRHTERARYICTDLQMLTNPRNFSSN